MDKKSDITGLIFDIQKYSLHDGPGIRTLVFMKGCPLSCQWCCNPESQESSKQIAFIETNCIHCGQCLKVCSEGAVVPDTFDIERERCDSCGKCANVCPANAKRLVGSIMTVEALLEEVEKDRVFYRNSLGGVTISGGEPARQYEFVSRFLREANARNIDTAVETCGFASWEKLQTIVEYAKLVFLDIKHMNDTIHKKYTGVGNDLILRNAEKVGAVASMVVRIPIIPGFNESKENIAETAYFISTLQNVKRIELLPYHRLGECKYKWLGKDYIRPSQPQLSEGYLRELRKIVSDNGIKTVVVSM